MRIFTRRLWLIGVLAALAPFAVAAGAVAEPVASPHCMWNGPSGTGSTNVAYPDDGARYWGGRGFVVPPGGELVLSGRYPHARYFSFNLYAEQLQPVDGLHDAQIAPDSGSANPFLTGADRSRGGTYTVRIVPGPAPAVRAPNTLYMSSSLSETAPVNHLMYRVYVPDAGMDRAGGVDLPSATLRLAGGAEVDLTAGCDQARLRDDAPQRLEAAEGVYRNGDLGPIPVTHPAEDPLRWERFFNVQHANGEGLTRTTPVHGHTDALADTGDGGYLSNIDNAYAYALGHRGLGPVLVLRGRAPSFPRTRAGAAVMDGGQVRYWSICTNERNSTRVLACALDEDVPLDDAGRFTLVISSPSARPANARPACGMAWLPWGAGPESFIVLRHMLPDPGFAQAIQRVERPGTVADVVGEYLPVGTHTTTPAVEAAGCGAS